MMHSIAQLAIFGNGLFGLRMRAVICRFITCCIYRMGMRIYHILPCNKAKHQHPGEDYMGFVFFQVSRLLKMLWSKVDKKNLKQASIAIELQLNSLQFEVCSWLEQFGVKKCKLKIANSKLLISL
jgi:hypothetical protein